jgi:hypothetical protein
MPLGRPFGYQCERPSDDKWVERAVKFDYLDTAARAAHAPDARSTPSVLPSTIGL